MSTQKYEINSYEDEKNSRFSIRTVEKHIELALRTFKEQLGGFFTLLMGVYFNYSHSFQHTLLESIHKQL